MNNKYKLIKDPKNQGCENCIVSKMFGINWGEDCKQFIKEHNLEDCCHIENEYSWIYVEDK